MLYFCFMEVTDELVEKIAHLARLHIPETEKESVKEELHQMIQFVDKLNEINTTNISPLQHMSENSNAVREDKVTGSCTTAEGLKNAKLTDGIFFKVPKVIKKV
jgi:aspartyl-tRNA(Asn)/glutamyl-tRNA(Gln) amidotransferase subunit C